MRALERGEIAAGRRRAGAAPRRVPRLPGMRAGVSRRAWPTVAGWRRRGSGSSQAQRAPAARARGARQSSGTSRSGGRCSRRRALFRATGIPAGAGGRRQSRVRDGDAGGVAAVIPSGARDMPRHRASSAAQDDTRRPTVALFRGCVMDTLFRHVHDATRRTLEANGYRVVEVDGQACCGALHEHAGDRDARRVARAPERRGAGRRGRLRRRQQRRAAARCSRTTATCSATRSPQRLAAKVRDVTRAPRRGGAASRAPRWSWTSPTTRPATCSMRSGCTTAPLAVLARDPRPPAPAAARLRQVLRQRGHLLGAAARHGPRGPRRQDRGHRRGRPTCPRVVATGNPGCLMQIGAGLLAAGLDTRGGASGRAADECVELRAGSTFPRPPSCYLYRTTCLPPSCSTSTA